MFVRYILLLGLALTAPGERAAAPMFVRYILLLGLALAGPASAAPIDDRDGVKVELETAYAPVAKAGGAMDAADPARATPSSNRNEATQAGNPLSKIPLSALTATRDRPLFSLSRRPPTPAIQANAEPAQAPAAARAGSAGAASSEVDRNNPQPRDERCLVKRFRHASGDTPASGGGDLRVAGENGQFAFRHRRKG